MGIRLEKYGEASYTNNMVSEDGGMGEANHVTHDLFRLLIG
ncbi:MAG: hypothetical protein ACR2QG_01405 [Gammaproteobacteria bacterium]